MKWVFLPILILSIFPASAWLRKHRDKLGWPCFLIGFLPFVTAWFHLEVAPISWAAWVGYTHGIEIYVVDVVAIVILIVMRVGLVRPFFAIPMMLYFIAVIIATFQAKMPEASIFYCWQLLRIFLVYMAVANVCAYEFAAATSILKGLAAAEILECLIAAWQRVGHHILQTPGTLTSQNELGIASHFVIFPFFALMLGGRRGWLPPVVVGAGLMTDALTTSRGALVLSLTGLALVWLLSSVARFSARKASVAIVSIAALGLVAPLAIASFGQRFEHGRFELGEDPERLGFKHAAWMMIGDHPDGVGANNFAFVANVGGYYNRSSGISYQGRASNVHNIYILILAETGVAGLATYIFMMIVPFVISLRNALFSRRGNADDPQKDILIGAGVTLLIVGIHSTEEWVMVLPVLQYLLVTMFGFIAGLTAEKKA